MEVGMSKTLFKVTLFLLWGILFLNSASAQDPNQPDSLWVGKNGALGHFPGNTFVVPVYLKNDESIYGISIPLEFRSGTFFATLDSVSYSGTRLENSNILEQRFPALIRDGVSPDTFLIGLFNITGAPLPVGDGVIFNIWFTGGTVGGNFMADSIRFGPNRLVLADSTATSFVPQFFAGIIPLNPGPPIFTLPGDQLTEAGVALSFQISATGAFPPVTLEFDTLLNVTNPARVPLNQAFFNGNNPGLFNWTPAFTDTGSWKAQFTATDAQNMTTTAFVNILVIPGALTCDILRGDVTCDGRISPADIVFLINYYFKGGPAPDCTVIR